MDNRAISRAVGRGLALLAALMLGACGQGAADTATAPTAAPAGGATSIPATAAPDSAAATAGPSEAPPAAAAPGPGEFRNPVIRADFPDPHIIKVGDTYHAYATNGASKNVQYATSADLVQWQIKSDAMPSLARWVQTNNARVWAPEVMQIGEQFVLYYTARDRESNKQCVGVAVAAEPQGKFRDPNERPLVCQTEEGGTIDAHPFRDADGSLYLYYKNDGNCCGQATYLYVQPLAPDGLTLTGEPTRLVKNDRAWEGRVVEAPTMWLQDGSYFLFFSGNDYAGVPYAVGYATCESPLGPCDDAAENPILASDLESQPLVIGPGHQTIIADADGELWLVYHVWQMTPAGLRGQSRQVWIDRLVFEGGAPDIVGPTRDPQPRP